MALTEVLKIGSRGNNVRLLQQSLQLTVDGVFGKNTENSVKEFQKSKGITADGIVGPVTWEALGLNGINTSNLVREVPIFNPAKLEEQRQKEELSRIQFQRSTEFQQIPESVISNSTPEQVKPKGKNKLGYRILLLSKQVRSLVIYKLESLIEEYVPEILLKIRNGEVSIAQITQISQAIAKITLIKGRILASGQISLAQDQVKERVNEFNSQFQQLTRSTTTDLDTTILTPDSGSDQPLDTKKLNQLAQIKRQLNQAISNINDSALVTPIKTQVLQSLEDASSYDQILQISDSFIQETEEIVSFSSLIDPIADSGLSGAALDQANQIREQLKNQYCPTPETLNNLITTRNNIVDVLNGIGNKLTLLSNSVNRFTNITNDTQNVINALELIEAGFIVAVGSGVLPAPALGPVLANSERIKKIIEKLEPQINNINSALYGTSVPLGIVSYVITQATGLLSLLDILIKLCSTEDTQLTPASEIIQQISIRQLQSNAQGQSQNNIDNNSYNGFVLKIEEVPFSPTVTRRKAVAFNESGIALLETPLSFTLNELTLINELKLIIDRDNLRSY